jgi:hypothetical protein
MSGTWTENKEKRKEAHSVVVPVTDVTVVSVVSASVVVTGANDIHDE